MTVIDGLGWALLAMAAAGSIYTLVAAHAVAKRRTFAFAPTAPVAVSVLKPLHGADANLKANLEAVLTQAYAAPVQLILGVQDGASPALAIARALKREHADRDIEIIVDERPHGSNRKVANLINMADAIRHDMIVIADSDIAVRPGYLQALAEACAAPGVTVVSCAYIGRAGCGVWSRLAAMGISYGFFPGVVLAAGGGLAAPVMGSTIALRREIFDAIGGFAPLADVLADDHEIGRRATGPGRAPALAGAIVAHECAEMSFSGLFSQELRWAVTVRTISPFGHYGSVITHALPLALAGAALVGGAAWALVLVAAAARLWLMRQVDQTAGAATGSRLLWPLRDMISLLVFVCSLFARSVRWRGARFDVSARGTMTPS